MARVVLADWQMRVVNEHYELNMRVHNLITFLSSDLAEQLSGQEIELLNKQLPLMIGYRDILDKRIKLFPTG